MRTFYKTFFIVSLIAVQATVINYGQEISQQIKSNRKKRFLIFPKGTVIQLVYCYLMSAIGTEGIFTVGVTLGTNWDVPVDLDKIIYDETMKIKANRRERRSLYPKIEHILSQLNIDGKSCIKQLLCNSRKNAESSDMNKKPSKNSFIDELLHTIFLYPSLPEEILEPIDEYDFIVSQCGTEINNGACIKSVQSTDFRPIKNE